jgi:2-dehydro-3-deoxy-D-gluconate 5-dehydrogenase
MSDIDTLVEQLHDERSLFGLEGKKALVVGGNKGLGQSMALALAAAGADVCVAARGPQGGQETASAIQGLGRNGAFISADVTDEAQVERLFGEIRKQMGGLDILVNSQGTVHLEPADKFNLDDWQRVIDVNLKSVVLCCKHGGRMMLEKSRGKIINISSVRAFQGRAEDLAYAPSKGAVNQLTRSLAIEWGPKGINVNGIAPVFTQTAINADLLSDPAKLAWVLGRIPMKRLGKLSDLFGPVIFLASRASDFVNGHTLPVDGGWLGA